MQAVSVRRSTERSERSAATDVELVERYLAGDERGFQVLVQRYQNRMVNFIQRSIGDRDRAEDLALITLRHTSGVRGLIDGDPRFFEPMPDIGGEAEDSSDHNYNDNTELVEAIAKGARGAYWDILRKLKG